VNEWGRMIFTLKQSLKKKLGYKIQFSKVLWTYIQYEFKGLFSVT